MRLHTSHVDQTLLWLINEYIIHFLSFETAWDNKIVSLSYTSTDILMNVMHQFRHTVGMPLVYFSSVATPIGLRSLANNSFHVAKINGIHVGNRTYAYRIALPLMMTLNKIAFVLSM